MNTTCRPRSGETRSTHLITPPFLYGVQTDLRVNKTPTSRPIDQEAVRSWFSVLTVPRRGYWRLSKPSGYDVSFLHSSDGVVGGNIRKENRYNRQCQTCIERGREYIWQCVSEHRKGSRKTDPVQLYFAHQAKYRL